MNAVANRQKVLPKSDILIDSGAQTSVLQIQPKNMKNFKRKSNQLLMFGNGTNMEIQGVGKLGPMSNISICKGLSENIASVSQLADQGCVVLFDRNRVIIMKPEANISINQAEVLLTGERTQDLYRIDLKTFAEQMDSIN
jgi:hypothetical protein